MTSDPFLAAERQITLEHQLREKVVNEEFKIWKKTVPLLYNTIYTHASKWPLLTIDFFPDYSYSADKNSISVKYVTGTNTSGGAPDAVEIHSLTLPSTLAPDFSSVTTNESIPVPTIENSADPSESVRGWHHPGEVNRVKVSPDGKQFVTFDSKGTVHLYDVNAEASQALALHKKEGYALEWISNTEFLSGAADGQIARWDTQKASPIRVILSHSSDVNDISYSKASGVLFGSVSDDYKTQIHDLRSTEDGVAIEIGEAQIQNAIAFHPTISYLFATGGKDNVVNLYDARNTRAPIRQFIGHNGSVEGLVWNPTEATSLLSWGLDRRVLTWDLNQLREEFNPTEVNEGKKRTKLNEDPCLQFVHGGHTNRINDFAVHPIIPNLFASVADDNLLEIYQPKTIEEEEEEDEEEGEEDEEEDKSDAEADTENSNRTTTATSGRSTEDGMEIDEAENTKNEGAKEGVKLEDSNGVADSNSEGEKTGKET